MPHRPTSAGVVSNNSHPRHCECAISQSLVRMCLFISSVRVRVSCRVRVRFNNSHLTRKSRTASYLAMGHIWHDTGGSIKQITVDFNGVKK